MYQTADTTRQPRNVQPSYVLLALDQPIVLCKLVPVYRYVMEVSPAQKSNLTVRGVVH